MFEIVFVGTGGAVPSPNRNLPATLVRHGDKKFLIDCGDGTVRQLAARSHVQGLGKALTEPFRVLITHEHIDHLLGIGTLFYYLDMTTNAKRVEVYAPARAASRIEALLDMVNVKGDLKVVLNVISPGIVYQDDEIVCEAFGTGHTEESCGFMFAERPKRHLLTDKLDRLGVPEGDLRRRLASGNSVTLPTGAVVRPDEVFGPPSEGQKLVVTGDAALTPGLIQSCEGADCIVAEAPYLEVDRSLATKNRHLTASDAALVASKANAKQLYLHHLSTRYRDDDVLAEANHTFTNAYVTKDFDYVKV